MKLSPRATAIEPTLIRQITNRARPTSLHLGLGQPDLGLSDAVRAALCDVRKAPYGPNRGIDEFVEKIAARYSAELGVIVTCGVQEALAVTILGLVSEGDDVLVPDPGFPAYANLVRAAGGTPVPYGHGDGFALDPKLVQQAWTDRTVAVVLNSPSNPTGAVSGADVLDAVTQLCAERDAFWISDEIYEDFVWVGASHSATEFSGHGIVVSGLSKSHAAMGLRIGWLAGPPEIVDGLVPLHQHLVTAAPISSQRAALAMLAEHDVQVAKVRGIFAARRALTLGHVSQWPDVPTPTSDGAFYVFADLRRHLRSGETSVDLALQLLDEVDVVTIPGAGFGAQGEGYLRLAYTVEEAILERALQAVGQFLRHRSTG